MVLNICKIGRIYHVIDKTTGGVVKVGSTIQSLQKRFNEWDYKKKYTNHFLREVRVLESSEFDWYDPKDRQSPFLWHLIAAETLEIVKQDTFNKDSFSNWASPLSQKLFGLGGDYGYKGQSLGGRRSGALAVKNKTGIHSPDFDRSLPGSINSPAQLMAKRANLKIGRTKEHQIKAAEQAGKKNIKSGWIFELGKSQGSKNAASGHCARISHLGASLGATTRNHNQYHVKRGKISATCPLCVKD